MEDVWLDDVVLLKKYENIIFIFYAKIKKTICDMKIISLCRVYFYIKNVILSV